MNSEALSYIAIENGRRPACKDARDGPHIGRLQYAFSNTTPFFASLSIAGALTILSPYIERAGAANWSAIINKKFGLIF